MLPVERNARVFFISRHDARMLIDTFAGQMIVKARLLVYAMIVTSIGHYADYFSASRRHDAATPSASALISRLCLDRCRHFTRR